MTLSARSPAVFLAILCFAALQMVPAAINGFPFVFYDTRGYHASGSAATGFIYKSIGLEFAPGNAADPVAVAAPQKNPNDADPGGGTPGRDGADPRDEAATAAVDQSAISFSRSPYYGLLLFVLFSIAPFLMAAVQSFAIAWIVWLTLRAIQTPGAIGSYIAAGVICAVATPLPFFAAYLIPDIFSAVVPLGFFLLAWSWQNLNNPARIGIWLLLTGSLLFHTTHLLLAVGLVILVPLLAMAPSLRPDGRGFAAATSTVVAAALGLVLFTVATRAVFGVDPVNPPYLTARGLQDGPVLAMIEAGCPGQDFAVCQADPEIDRDSQAFLWGPDGQYFTGTAEIRQRLSDEDFSVFFAAAREYPLMQLRASLRNSLDQALMFGLYEFGTAPDVMARSAPHWMPPKALNAFSNSAVVNDRIPLGAWSRLVYVVAGVATVILIALALTGRVRGAPLVLLIVVIAVLLGNAVLGGALSDPHHRYQARLIWLLPLIATLLCIAALRPDPGDR